MPKILTREEWLATAVAHLVPDFESIGEKVPKTIKASCGFPSRNPLGATKRSIGECWSDKASEGKYFEIFISPTLQDRDVVLATLVHEIVHAVVGLEAKHGKPFIKVARAMGLEGKITATVAGEALTQRLEKLAKQLGPYPHAKLNGMTNGKPKDKCRLVKIECPDCGYICRTTRKWIDDSGLPICPCGSEFKAEEAEGEDE